MESESGPLPIVLVPGLFGSPRLFGEQIPSLWRHTSVTVVGRMRHADITEIARDVLAHAPERFVLVGLSLGGYVAFEILRQAPRRVGRLALLGTSARPDTPEQSGRRREQIDFAESGGFERIPDLALPSLVHPSRHGDEGIRRTVRRMARETGPETFVLQQRAAVARPDSRSLLASVTCPTLVLAGADDALIPAECSTEIAAGIPGARHVVLSECGHLSTLEHPERVSRELVDLVLS
ncbi:alpha/beta fold hydrolase [Nocardiopsis alba]|uniref:Alpha/beta fold hydrolase n=1 Tax=Nocardiopsis alba TaxID=53437 RepID=A0A7K2IZY1_9ACTN|nr:alpha/beta fold hydrolase [Nocardiopsis alba]MYR35551.1 alpha/beta fold hydrolase [Nocardiopsis alba]